ncbi:hypothetical protein GCM10010529_01140 [Nesterenkonia aethiopica]|uniref:Uncharacterized protein n=1 Tax=Nesterenkonia aethiopica TaxID=269144 RepID=A0ABP6LM35_9MICC
MVADPVVGRDEGLGEEGDGEEDAGAGAMPASLVPRDDTGVSPRWRGRLAVSRRSPGCLGADPAMRTTHCDP